MNDRSFTLIVSLIETCLGLKPHSIHAAIWKEILERRMTFCNLSVYADYYQLLLHAPEEMQEVIELIVNPETWFFRDQGVFDLLNLLIKQNQFQTSQLKILCMACSSGEEPYSIAMKLLECGLPRHAFSIEAVDVSKKAIEKAQTGIYRINSFRGKDLSYREQYFNKIDTGYLIKDEIKELVQFYQGNLLQEDFSCAFISYDWIFCRNLLIYLDSSGKSKILRHVKKLLSPNGIFSVGPAETQTLFNDGFIPMQFPGTYSFRIQAQQPTSQVRDHALDSSIPLNNIPTLHQEKNSSFQKALALADQGSFEASMQMCFHYIQQYGASPEVYYLIGLIHQALGKEIEAEKFFRKTVYLKPSHYEALVCLALIHESKGELNEAELFRKRAKKNI